ncbi:MAG: DNA recombination protein RmuC [candidate division KSB1 bacterium]|nr:DNA recombination protein RmuC [candidate division KSB1 bacterium]MDZ7336113.1 DNA recombination protein RmuC [candidate division KSB1 bacterium]MDZ7358911.1 DNA recombination protein RmuC [candidate division KSB1 bacterium]MDZ7399700.1 DNA recombination protein RmuC [candidate division KSB1 bacterium]
MIISFVAGFFLALVAALVLRIIQGRTAQELAAELFRESEMQRRANIELIIENLKANFGNLSLEALSRSTEEFLKLARARLESEREVSIKELDKKRALIDLQLSRMTTELDNVAKLIKELEQDRIEKFGQLSVQLKNTSEQTAALIQTTNQLRQALASSRARGQWGERMAEDVLRLAGFIENVNYLKQKSIEGSRSRPDFTFLLPKNLRLNMDVKFPMDNYMKFLSAENELEKARYRNDFLRDVRAKISELTSRDYIDPSQNTVDYVLLFIPNEQIYAFIHEQDSSILDEGLKHRVVFCSPLTLYAILAVIRQAVDNFALERTSNEILSLFGAFKKQWNEFISRLEILGKKISEAQKEYEQLVATRRRQLEKPLNQIDALRAQRGLPPADDQGAIGV